MSIISKELTDKIIAAFYDVYYDLGYGFLENVYQNALYKELMRRGYACEAQKAIEVYHKGDVVGKYYADILVNNRVILELKSADSLTKTHESQLMNYLKATDIEVGLLLNFGPQPSFKRKVMTVAYKEKYNKNRMTKYGYQGGNDSVDKDEE